MASCIHDRPISTWPLQIASETRGCFLGSNYRITKSFPSKKGLCAKSKQNVPLFLGGTTLGGTRAKKGALKPVQSGRKLTGVFLTLTYLHIERIFKAGARVVARRFTCVRPWLFAFRLESLVARLVVESVSYLLLAHVPFQLDSSM